MSHKEESFEALFEQSISQMDGMDPGQLFDTTIVSVSDTCIFLDLSGKSEGVLDSEEVKDKDGNITVKEGDPIRVYFLAAKNGEMQFTTKIGGHKAGKAMIETAYESQIPVEGTVEKEIKGGYEIKIGDTRAFCPYSQMGAKRVEDNSIYIGKSFTFKIIEYKEQGRNILVSNRAIINEEKKQKIEGLKKELKVGNKVTGTVKQLEKFGAFIDLQGFQALMPISEISRSRVNDITKELKVGQLVEGIILDIDWERERISMSRKALIPDPWTSAKINYPEGSEHEGTVARLTDFGAFVTLEAGLDGLIHVSDLNIQTRDNKPSDLFKIGDTVKVEIKSVDAKERRMSLKPVSALLKDKESQKYMEEETDTYNPFAALLKDRVKK